MANGGGTGASLRSRKVASAASCALLAFAAAGCGAVEGVADDATATVYAAASLCPAAERTSARRGDQAGGIRIRVLCLSAAEHAGGLDLATIGANARRATEDSTAVGYIGEPSAAATRFSQPILESAGVPQLSGSGAAAMSKLLRAVEEADTSGSLREAVGDALE